MYSRVYVEITNICNLHCSFCHGHSRPPRRMDRQDFARVLAQLKGQTEYIYYHLMGEPLSHPDLPVFLQMANDCGFRSVITTNGTLLEKRGMALIDACVHKVNISLHSFEKEDQAAHQDYMRRVADFADCATKAGVIVSFRLWNKGFDGGKNDSAVAFLHHRFPGDWTENTRGYRIRDKLFLEWGQRFTWPDADAPLTTDQVTCRGMRDHFGILCDGSLVPCCLDADGIITLGNIFRQDIADILATPRARAMAEGFAHRIATEDLCRRCGYARRFHSTKL